MEVIKRFSDDRQGPFTCLIFALLFFQQHFKFFVGDAHTRFRLSVKAQAQVIDPWRILPKGMK